MNKKQDKITLKRLISNVIFILKYAFSHDSLMAVSYIVSRCIFYGTAAYMDTFLLKEIIDIFTTTVDINGVMKVLAIMLVLQIIRFAIFRFCENMFWTRMIGFSGAIQRELMAKAQMIDLKCYDIPEYFDDFIIAASQSEEMSKKAIMSVANIAASITSMLIAGTMIITVNPVIAIFPAAGFIINIITRFIITKLEYQYNIEKQRIGRKADYSRRVFYQPEYAKEIKLTGIEEALMEQYDDAIAEERKMAMKYSLKILPPTLINWICTYTMCQFYAVPVYLAYLAIEKKVIGLGDVASLKNATNEIKNLLDQMNYSLVDFQTVGQYAEKFRRFMDYPIGIEGCEGTEPIPENDCTLELKNVSFKYKDSEKYVLKDVSMTIRKGEKLALVGENGAGKTTLIKLIMRLYDVTEGSITFGGTDIRKLNIKQYREKIGTVFQDFQIYGATLAENVKMDYVDEDDLDSREKILTALKRADFGNKLANLPDGIDTELTKEFSDNGTMLSGGESQKAAIARMFMRDMPIAILDEPSSALDPIAEYRLNKSMLENAENQAVILISHRLSTTKDADRIILLENGSIAESGTHSELIAGCGKYAEMWKVQAEKYCAEIYA
ncbi:MAG: ABC transporter ATP-binding protein/permease [Lachnospiraceae bacterium]|nr:ABC transporter ATP-binding protein/permease [Lachnospiraceae bacterium]